MDRDEFAERFNGIVIPEGAPLEEINTLMRPISEAILPDAFGATVGLRWDLRVR